MKIADIETELLSIPLIKPFKTALRTVRQAESVMVRLICDDGTVGFGEAPPTHVITGDSLASINYAVRNVLRPQLIGLPIERHERIHEVLETALVHNSSAKAAIDIALYDCLGKKTGLPLYQLLGGYRHRIQTDFTVSVNSPEEMAEDAVKLVGDGFATLKVKVGNSSEAEDVARVEAIRKSVGNGVRLRLDANQGWTVKQAISSIRRMERMGLQIELVEQPLPARDFAGMKQVTASVATPIMADESIFSPADAARLLAMHGCDLINIKLMKAGGIAGAEKINTLAEAYGIECMVGCMVESPVSVSAAAHFAAAKKNVTRCDLDTPLMFTSNPVTGGIRYQKNEIILPDRPGLGIKAIRIAGGKGSET